VEEVETEEVEVLVGEEVEEGEVIEVPLLRHEVVVGVEPEEAEEAVVVEEVE
jgi:hypothetical protein